jgi:hypothetical protein
MNTNQLKRFAQEARLKLIDQIGAKLEKVLSTDSAELREKAGHIQKLQEAIRQTNKEQVIDTVAYTWFNRLVALRFMDINGYEPISIGVVSPTANATLPELLQEAKAGNIPQELPVNHQRIYNLLNGKIPSSNPQNEAYRELLVGACNQLHSIFPFLFERINDHAELLLPDDLLSEYSIVEDIRKGMQSEDCEEVEILGWLYQFYISEKKDQVFAAKGRVKKEDIPAATQLFTPRWIVEYMVQNTVGKLWLQNNPNSNIRQHMPYFIESPSVEAEDFLKVNSVEDITLLDQACGSGHILVYGFELLSKIYEEEGYNESEIPKLIIEKNLYGFEIDQRAAQLAGLALMLKARSYQRRFFRKDVTPNILCYKDLNLTVFNFNDCKETFSISKDSQTLKDILTYQYTIAENIEQRWSEDITDEDTGEIITIDRSEIKVKKGKVLDKDDYANIIRFGKDKIAVYVDEIKDSFRLANIDLDHNLYFDLKLMLQATNLGSLIIPETKNEIIVEALSEIKNKHGIKDVFLRHELAQIIETLEQLNSLSKKYHCVVDNPPYMGNGNMNGALSAFVKKHYPYSKADLMACFMEAGLKTLHPKGFLGMINQHSWMFLSSYEKLREKLIRNTFFDTILHLGPRTFPEIGGEVVQNASFTFWNTKLDSKGKYIRLVDEGNTELKRLKTLEAIEDPSCNYFFSSKQENFKRVPGKRLGYWLTEKGLVSFESSKPIGELGVARRGLQPGFPDIFKRRWPEIAINKIQFGYKSREESLNENLKWFLYNDGGINLRWYGTLNYLINWQNNGSKIKETGKAIIPNEQLYSLEGITWSKISSGSIKARFLKKGLISGDAAPFFISKNPFLYIGYFNSKVTSEVLKLLSATTNLTTGNMAEIPFPQLDKKQEEIVAKISKECVAISEKSWNSGETSWDFQQNELIRIKGQDLEEAYDSYCHYWQNKFMELHKNEEALNKQFIEIYGLQDELSPNVSLKDITILKEEASIVKGELVFNAKEIMKQFVSYAVGCMFGRYSLDKPGLILANQGETLENYLKAVTLSAVEVSFLPDDDNIIPILDNEWFEDDIVGRFYEFLKVTFGKPNFEKNLAFVEECLGKDIRKYFLKDFYNDHWKRYKKRPIYWMFSSPSGAFNVLIYMHRYTQDSLNQILNGYLKAYREKLSAEIDKQAHLKNKGTAREQTLAQKEEDRIQKVLLELQEYERELYKLATERISIDLDDGVFVNYNKFGNVIKEVKGLNDKKAKAKVKKFDWIDVSQIR